MSTDLEDLVRATLADHAPSNVRPADWAALRARAARRTAAGRAAVVVGAAAIGTLAVTTALTTEPAVVGPAVTPQQTLEPTETSAPAQPVVALDPSVIDTALTYERLLEADWSAAVAERETIERALGTLMASAQIVDASAQPRVIWSSEAHTSDAAQGPQVLVAVEQPSGWVLGFWDERAPYGEWIRAMSFGDMPGGPLEGRLVGFVVPAEDYANLSGGTHVIYAAPVGTHRIVKVVGEIEGVSDPPSGEAELSPGFGDYSFGGTTTTIRAYGADGSLLDEQTYAE